MKLNQARRIKRNLKNKPKMIGIHLQQIYCYKGGPHKNTTDRHLFTITDHPTNGQSAAFILEPIGNSNRLTAFSPAHFTSHNVARDAGELRGQPIIHISEVTRKRWIKFLTDRWEERCRLGLKSDYNVAALVITRLGGKVPTFRPKRVEERVANEGEKKRGGKPVADKLLKPIAKSGKRSDVARHFMDGAKSIREAMAVFGMTRSTVLTHLYRLNTEHGIGYNLIGETAELTLPAKETKSSVFVK